VGRGYVSWILLCLGCVHEIVTLANTRSVSFVLWKDGRDTWFDTLWTCTQNVYTVPATRYIAIIHWSLSVVFDCTVCVS
jgi:hypothetical protein